MGSDGGNKYIKAKEKSGRDKVALSGGVFQNRLLLRLTEEQLAQNWNTKLDSIKKKLVKEQQFKDVQKPVDIGQSFQE